MNDSGCFITWVSPLPEPELHHPCHPYEWPVEPKIAFAVKERRQPFCHDKDKARDTQDVDQKKR
jgi:hypothetical protein